MGRVVVTGSSGSLGVRVVRLLSEHPDRPEVVAIDCEPSLHAPNGLREVLIDLASPAERDRLDRAVLGASTVIHLAWRTADGIDDGPEEEANAAEANLASLRHVLAAADRAGADHVIHLSSATVYGAWPDNPVPLSEDAPLRPVPSFSFAVTKAESERILAAWADDHRTVAIAVLRPTVTVGSPARPLYQALGGTRSPRGDDDGRTVQFLHVDDLATAVAVVWAGRLAGVFNVAPDRGVGEATARALAGGVAKVALPARTARAVSAWAWDLWRLGVPREAHAYARWPWVIAPDRLLAAGWSPEHTSEEALVVTDERSHWDDLPPGKRQNLTVLAAAGGLAAVGASAVGVVVTRRRRSSSGGIVRRVVDLSRLLPPRDRRR